MGTKHLTEADRLRARTLFFDAGLPKARICQITGFSLNQVKLAIREKTPKTRSGRPPRRRPGAAGTAGAPVAGGLLASGEGVADGIAVAGEHGHGEHGEHGDEGSLSMSHGHSGPPPQEAVHRASDRMLPLHAHEQQQQQQQQGNHGYPGHSQPKWDTAASYNQQPSYYASWPPPGPTPLSPNPTVAGAAGGPRGSLTPTSPPLPLPTATSMRMFSATVGPLGIPSPPASSAAGSIQGRGDGSGSSITNSGGNSSRRSDAHDFSSSTSSSLASSATSYSSASYSHMASSSSASGGFSLPSILASATGP
ncbi:hypothetical protein SCUCBS95973_005093 [Sporothrix curviconia]|uniref:Uncharacterized protein n=1 Tax=Sporothrix curviconia TaxID=1260050 RepID=A0ABP0BVN5_9PEZI